MEFEPEAPICELKASRLFRKFIGDAPGAIVTLHPTSSVSRHTQAKPFDAGKHPVAKDLVFLPRFPTPTDAVCFSDEPRLFRYMFSSTINQASLTRMRIKANRVWTRLILGADGF